MTDPAHRLTSGHRPARPARRVAIDGINDDQRWGDDAAQLLLDEIKAAFRQQKAHAEAALRQLQPDDGHRRLDEESNSAAVLVKHMAGNMRSRWRDFLTSDGEKPDRNRDAEFEAARETPEELLSMWEEGWQILANAVEPLTREDMLRTVTIRGEPNSVARALLRQLTHYQEHVGQIVFLAKHLRGAQWENLSIPRRRPDPRH